MSNHRARTWNHKKIKPLNLKLLLLDYHLDDWTEFLLVFTVTLYMGLNSQNCMDHVQRFKILIHFSTSLVVLEFKTNQGMYCEFTLNLAGGPCIMNPGLQFLVKGLIKSGPSAWHVPDQIERQTGLWKTINKQKWLSFFFHSIKLLNMIWYNFWIMSWVS